MERKIWGGIIQDRVLNAENGGDFIIRSHIGHDGDFYVGGIRLFFRTVNSQENVVSPWLDEIYDPSDFSQSFACDTERELREKIETASIKMLYSIKKKDWVGVFAFPS